MTPAPRRRLIKADLNLRLTGSDEEEDDPFGGRTSMTTSFSRCKSESTVFGTSTEASSTNTSRSSSPDSSPSSSPKTVRPIPAPRTSKAKKEGESSHPPSQQTAKQIDVKTAEEKDKDVRTSFSRLKNRKYSSMYNFDSHVFFLLIIMIITSESHRFLVSVIFVERIVVVVSRFIDLMSNYYFINLKYLSNLWIFSFSTSDFRLLLKFPHGSRSPPHL